MAIIVFLRVVASLIYIVGKAKINPHFQHAVLIFKQLQKRTHTGTHTGTHT